MDNVGLSELRASRFLTYLWLGIKNKRMRRDLSDIFAQKFFVIREDIICIDC
jgi:hypothetical protein